jgi:hypothetical protein
MLEGRQNTALLSIIKINVIILFDEADSFFGKSQKLQQRVSRLVKVSERWFRG